MIIGHYMIGQSDPGGVRSYIRSVSRAQREAGHEIRYFDHICRMADQKSAPADVVYAESDEDLLSRARAACVDILHIHTTVDVGPKPAVPVIRTLHGHQPYCPSGSRYFKRQERPCDRAYSPLGCTWGHFVDRCGSVRPRNFADDFRRTQIERRSLDHVPVICVSDFLREQMQRNGYPPEHLHVLHNSAPEPRAFEPPQRSGVPRFAFIGRMTSEKGVEWLLRAAREVKVPLHLDLAGEGPAEEGLKALARELRLEEHVTFHGWVNGERVHAIIAAARALVFPSVWHEPAGIVSGEAMANGRAVITSRVGGIPEYVQQDVNGLLVEPNDIEGMARAIELLARDWERARDLGLTGSRIAQERFGFRAHIERLQALYERYAAVTIHRPQTIAV